MILYCEILCRGRERYFPNVVDFSFDKTGNVLVFKTSQEHSTVVEETLQWVDLRNNTMLQIWPEIDLRDDHMLGGFSLDGKGEQVAFILKERSNSSSTNEIWYYKVGMRRAYMEINAETSGVDTGMFISTLHHLLMKPVITFFLNSSVFPK